MKDFFNQLKGENVMNKDAQCLKNSTFMYK